jgi:hypothetical protein
MVYIHPAMQSTVDVIEAKSPAQRLSGFIASADGRIANTEAQISAIEDEEDPVRVSLVEQLAVLVEYRDDMATRLALLE